MQPGYCLQSPSAYQLRYLDLVDQPFNNMWGRPNRHLVVCRTAFSCGSVFKKPFIIHFYRSHHIQQISFPLPLHPFGQPNHKPPVLFWGKVMCKIRIVPAFHTFPKLFCALFQTIGVFHRYVPILLPMDD